MPESQPGLTVIHKKGDIIENTIGRVGALPMHLTMLTPDAIVKNPTKEMGEEVKEAFKDVPWHGNVELYLGHNPLFRQMKRLFQKERRTNLFARVLLGIPTTIAAWIESKLSRIDHYNPFTEAAVVYHSRKAVAMHEIGHAVDFDQAKYPTLRTFAFNIPLMHSKLEWNASHHAMKRLVPEERPKAAKVLEPALGTHVGGELTAVSVFPFWTPLIGAAVGHLHSRLAKRNFFFNEPEPARNTLVQPRVVPALAHA